MFETGGQAVFEYVLLQLFLELFVCEADRGRFAPAAFRVGVGVDDLFCEVRVVFDEFARVAVLRRHGVDVLDAAAICGEVSEVLVDARHVSFGIRRGSSGRPVEGVVRVRGHDRPAVIDEVAFFARADGPGGLKRVRRADGATQRLVAQAFAGWQLHDDRGGARGPRSAARSEIASSAMHDAARAWRSGAAGLYPL